MQGIMGSVGLGPCSGGVAGCYIEAYVDSPQAGDGSF